MADVFLSYARDDHDRAQALAEALAQEGWTVWWDRRIVAGEEFDRAIERELTTAKSVVVLWSEHSVNSEWVKNEAALAAERGVLVPALIANVRPPLEFRRRQTADLGDWRGASGHPGYQALCAGVRAAAGGQTPPHRRIVMQPQRRRMLWWARFGLLLLLLVLGGGAWWLRGGSVAPPPGAVPEATHHPAAERATVDGTSVTAGLADLVVGSYVGNVIADSRGSSRSDVTLTVSKLDRRTVRVGSDYPRLGTVDVGLDRIGNLILNAGGDTTLRLDLDRSPPALDYNPHGEVAYSGEKR